MSTREYVIVSSSSERIADIKDIDVDANPKFRARPEVWGGDGVFGVDVESAVLTHSELLDEQLNPRNRSISEVVPMKLFSAFELTREIEVEFLGPDWGLTATGSESTDQDGEGIRVGVLDTGIDQEHTAFSHLNNIDGDDFTGNQSLHDEHGHGTFCSGLIFGSDKGNDTSRPIGTAPGITDVYIGRVSEDGYSSSSRMLKGISGANKWGADIVVLPATLSVHEYIEGIVEEGDYTREQAIYRATSTLKNVIYAFDDLCGHYAFLQYFGSGGVVIGAAGNESIQPTVDLPCALPAAVGSIISVSALDIDGAGYKLAKFSHSGADLSAPGVNVESALLDGGLGIGQGTSYAAPIAAGVAARHAQKLKIENEGVLDPTLLRRKIIRSGDKSNIRLKDIDKVGQGIIKSPG